MPDTMFDYLLEFAQLSRDMEKVITFTVWPKETSVLLGEIEELERKANSYKKGWNFFDDPLFNASEFKELKAELKACIDLDMPFSWNLKPDFAANLHPQLTALKKQADYWDFQLTKEE